MGASSRRRNLPFAALLALFLPTIAGAQSQTTSSIRGSVTGPDGAGLADVSVRVRHVPTGAERSVLTGPDGSFVVLLLQPGGPYELSARYLGFGEVTRPDIHLAIGETFTVALELHPTAVPVPGVSVDVSRGDLVTTRRVGPVTLLDEPVLASLPVPSRDVMDLTVLSTLVRTTAGGGFSIGGQNDRYNSILVDGLAAGDAFGLTPSTVPGAQAGARLLPLDAVAQYEVLVAPYDARLSGFAGGVLNAVTRTGTNDFTWHAFALGRDAALTGDLTLPSGTAQASGIRRELLGVSAGGPLVRDRIHYFVAGEIERRTTSPAGYNAGRDDPALVGITPETLEAFKTVFDQGLGIDTGHYGAYDLNQQLANAFARVDWSLSGGNRLTIRDVFARASNDESPNRTPFEPYGFSSNAVFRTSTNNLLSAQLFTDLGRAGGNELDLSVQRTTDRTKPASDFPQVEALLSTPFFALNATRPIRVGAQFFAQDDDLEQTSVRLTNTLTRVRGASTWTLGASAAWYDVHQTYLPGEKGEYYFATWDDVLDNAPLRYQRTVLLDGQSPGIAFALSELGGFAQDQMEVGPFTLRFGLRADAPFVLDHPGQNEEVARVFGHDTSHVPSGSVLLSPRVGVNWQGGTTRRTQIRAGAGLFTGQLPYVWLANAFHDTGLRSEVQACSGRWNALGGNSNVAPPFDPRDLAATCLSGAPTVARTVTVFDDALPLSAVREGVARRGSGADVLARGLRGRHRRARDPPGGFARAEHPASGHGARPPARLWRHRARALRNRLLHGLPAEPGAPRLRTGAPGHERVGRPVLVRLHRAARLPDRPRGLPCRLRLQPLVRSHEPLGGRPHRRVRLQPDARRPQRPAAHALRLRSAPQGRARALRHPDPRPR